MLWMVPITSVGDGARSLDRLPAGTSGAKRIIRFMVVVRAEWLAVENVKGLVWEGFLHPCELLCFTIKQCRLTWHL